MLYVGIVVFSIYLIFKLLYIFVPLRRRKEFKYEPEVKSYRSFAILVPAYNEKDVIINCVISLLNIDYYNYNIYIIDDGSTDNTLKLLIKTLFLIPFELSEDSNLNYKTIRAKYCSSRFPNVYVISKENGGKADALNAGISCCSEEYTVTLDADCMLKQNSLSIMNRVFQNENVIAAGGTVHIVQSIDNTNGLSNILFKLKNIIRYQVLQYLTAFYLHKYTQSRFNAIIVISGAYGVFKRSLLIDIKGYRKSVGEDMDITLKIHNYIKESKHNYIMTYVPHSICYTECPENLKSLTKQRIRWQKAFIDCTVKYGLKMFRHFKTAVSMFFIFDSLILGTLTTIMLILIPLYIILSKQVSLIFYILFLIDFFLSVIESIISIMIAARFQFVFNKKDYLKVALFIPFQLISFRFLNILYIILGTFGYIKNKNQWNKADRLGRSLPQSLILKDFYQGVYPKRKRRVYRKRKRRIYRKR